MKRGQLIEVTQKHIDEGLVGDCMLCPVALALTQALGKPCWAGERWVGLTRSEARFTPVRVKQFVRRFDDGESVTPFKFYLVPLN